MIPFAIARPRPEATFLVETKGKNIESMYSSGIPGPLSIKSISHAVLKKLPFIITSDATLVLTVILSQPLL